MTRDDPTWKYSDPMRFRSKWDGENHTYSSGAVVIHGDHLWMAQEDPVGPPGEEGPGVENWVKVAPTGDDVKYAGEWSPVEIYNRNTIVRRAGGTYIAFHRTDSAPPNSADWGVLSDPCGPKGASFDIDAGSSLPTDEHKRIDLTLVGSASALIPRADGVDLTSPGTWIFVGALELGSDSAEPLDALLESWVEWDIADGVVRKTPIASNSGTVGGGQTFTNRLDITVLYGVPTKIRLMSNAQTADGSVAKVSGFFSANLLAERPVTR